MIMSLKRQKPRLTGMVLVGDSFFLMFVSSEEMLPQVVDIGKYATLILYKYQGSVLSSNEGGINEH